MRMSIKNLAVCGIFLSAALLTGCNSVLDDQTDGVMMELNTTRTSDATSKALSRATETVPGELLFWKTTDNFGTFYYHCDVDNLNNYNAPTTGEGNKFNTGKEYPTDGTSVYAAGYSPIASVTASADYKTLTVSDLNAGLVDVLTSAEPLTGSKDNIFNGDLTFDHTLTKVTFKAKFDYTMDKIRQVSNIRVVIPTTYLPTTWAWNDTNKKFEVQPTNATTTLSIAYTSTLSTKDTEYEIGTCYLRLPSDNGGKLTPITLLCNLYKFDSTTQFIKDKTYSPLTIQLKELDGVTPAVNVQPGESYSVVFLFSNDTWTFTAVKEPWLNGGLITVPVDPAGGSSTH